MIDNIAIKTLTEEERCYRYALHRTEGIGGVAIGRLIQAAGSARGAWELPEKELSQIVNSTQASNIIKARARRDPEVDFDRLREQGIGFLTVDEPAYPEKLRRISDAPYAIYYKGGLPSGDEPAIAMIGARICSEYGRLVARQFGKGLAECGIQVISGMARGVDGISQWAALQAGGTAVPAPQPYHQRALRRCPGGGGPEA